MRVRWGHHIGPWSDNVVQCGVHSLGLMRSSFDRFSQGLVNELIRALNQLEMGVDRSMDMAAALRLG